MIGVATLRSSVSHYALVYYWRKTEHAEGEMTFVTVSEAFKEDQFQGYFSHETGYIRVLTIADKEHESEVTPGWYGFFHTDGRLYFSAQRSERLRAYVEARGYQILTLH